MRERLAIDPESPYLLVANGDVLLAAGDFGEAESLYLRALAVVPEFTAAQLGMVEVCRLGERRREECAWTIAAIRSPLSLRGDSFWSNYHLPYHRLDRNDYRPRLFESLRRMDPEDAGPLVADPVFEARHRLKGITKPPTKAAYQTDDYRIYREIIERLIAEGESREAVRLAMTYGELMDWECKGYIHSGLSFKKSRDLLKAFYLEQGYTMDTYRSLLTETFRAAGLTRREKLLGVDVREQF